MVYLTEDETAPLEQPSWHPGVASIPELRERLGMDGWAFRGEGTEPDCDDPLSILEIL